MFGPSYWQKACHELSARDPIMHALIVAYPGVHLQSQNNPLLTLARSIVGQQISVKAASSIWAKLESCLGLVDVKNIQKTSIEVLRTCGLSERKALYLKDLARFSLEGRLELEALQDKDEAEIIEALTTIKGIGRWTAEMFLIFCLQKPDIYPVDDIGIQKAIAKHYYESVRPSLAQMQEIAVIWQPWRTVASWYLWRSLDPEPVSY